MKNYKASAILIAGLVMVAATLSVYFLSDSIYFRTEYEELSVHFWSLIFLLVTEAAFFGGLLFLVQKNVRSNRVLLISGIQGTLFLLLVATFIIAVTANHYQDNVNGLIILEIKLLAVAIMLIVATVAFSHWIYQVDEKVSIECRFMEDCERRVNSLLHDDKNKRFKKQLNQLYEDIRFGDKVGSSTVDGRIMERLDSLEGVLQAKDVVENDVMEGINEVATLIKQRKVEFTQTKRGKF